MNASIVADRIARVGQWIEEDRKVILLAAAGETQLGGRNARSIWYDALEGCEALAVDTAILKRLVNQRLSAECRAEQAERRFRRLQLEGERE